MVHHYHRLRLLSGFWVGLLAGPAAGQTRILFVGNSFTHGKYAPVLNYNTATVTDENYGLPLSSPRYQIDPTMPGPWGGLPGIFKKMADQAGLNYEVHVEVIERFRGSCTCSVDSASPRVGRAGRGLAESTLHRPRPRTPKLL